MVKKTISELDNIDTNQESGAVVAIEQNGATFKGPVRPNPPHQTNILTQAQLEAAFGLNLEIPTNSTSTIILDDQITLTKPFKLGNNVFLRTFASSGRDVYNLTGINGEALFQKINPLDTFGNLQIHDVGIQNQGGQPILFDIVGSIIQSQLIMERVELFDFASLGTIEVLGIDFRTVFISNPLAGLILKNVQVANISALATVQAPPGVTLTLLSFVSNLPSRITLNNVTAFGHDAGDALLFLDPNALPGTIFNITNCSVDGGDLYQQGVEIAINSITDNGGLAVYNTATDHHLNVGDKIKLRGFGVALDSNGAKVVTVADAVTSFETGDAFDVTDTGILRNRPVEVVSVADNGSGGIRLTTAVPHGLTVGKAIRLRDFANYDQTAIVTAVDTPLTGTTVDVDIPFGATETGLIDAASLDETSVLINAENNGISPDSMNQAEVRTTTTVEFIPTVGSFIRLERTIPVEGDFVEDVGSRRFSINNLTGVVTYIGNTPIESGDVIFDATIQKISGGASATAVVSLFINDIQQTKTNRITTPYTASAKADISYTGGLFIINPGDTFELKIDATSDDPTFAITKMVIRE